MATKTIARMPLASMVKVDELISKLEKRDRDREDFMILDPKDVDLRYEIGDKEAGEKDKFLMTFNDRDIELSDSAISSACRMLKTTPQYFRENFLDWQRKFCSDFSSAMRHNERGCYARTDCLRDGISRRVESFVGGNWQLNVGESTIVRGVAERLNAQYGDSILGVQVVTEGGRNSVYRFVFGNTIMGNDNHVKMYPMISLIHSPYGFSTTELSLGIYRVICENGALRRDFSAGTAKWNQRSNPDTFFSKMNGAIDAAGDFSNECKRHFERMVEKRINHHPLIVLKSLFNGKAITNAHLESATMFLTERDIRTEYDMLNVLTDSAKTLHPLQKRQEAESNALRIAMHGDGFGGFVTESRLAEMELLES